MHCWEAESYCFRWYSIYTQIQFVKTVKYREMSNPCTSVGGFIHFVRWGNKVDWQDSICLSTLFPHISFVIHDIIPVIFRGDSDMFFENLCKIIHIRYSTGLCDCLYLQVGSI